MIKTERPSLLVKYNNGNYTVKLYTDGTKIKYSADDYFLADFPDSIDLKITDYCDMNCPMCHESSSLNGAHGDLNEPFLETLHEGTELAIGGGNPLAHPNLVPFLQRMKDKNVVCNLTVNEEHFLRQKDFIAELMTKKLVWGLGISLGECNEETLLFAEKNKTVVLHLICGLTDEQFLRKLYDRGLKVLFLGYKTKGRGAQLYSPCIEKNIVWLKENIRAIARRFDTLCFDNLALEQLCIKEQIPQELFRKRYMGDDGTASMYIDLVKRQFAVSSVSMELFPIGESITDMFCVIKRRVFPE